MKVEQKITIELDNGTKLELNDDEAKQLYNKLHEMYGETHYIPYYPYYPNPIYYEPQKIWYSDGTGKSNLDGEYLKISFI